MKTANVYVGSYQQIDSALVIIRYIYGMAGSGLADHHRDDHPVAPRYLFVGMER